MSTPTPGFPNQNVYNSRFLINHPQLAVLYHQRQTYLRAIAIAEANPSQAATYYNSHIGYKTIYYPAIEQYPN